MRVLIAVLLAANLAACSTVSGVGKDISSAADWTKEKMGGR
jgi:predicted small secreted protein